VWQYEWKAVTALRREGRMKTWLLCVNCACLSTMNELWRRKRRCAKLVCHEDRRLDPSGRSSAPYPRRRARYRGPDKCGGVPIIVLLSPLSLECVSRCKNHNMSIFKSTFPAAFRPPKCSFRSVTKRWNSVSQRPGSDRYVDDLFSLCFEMY
jgi:hypothetical protein